MVGGDDGEGELVLIVGGVAEGDGWRTGEAVVGGICEDFAVIDVRAEVAAGRVERRGGDVYAACVWPACVVVHGHPWLVDEVVGGRRVGEGGDLRTPGDAAVGGSGDDGGVGAVAGRELAEVAIAVGTISHHRVADA